MKNKSNKTRWQIFAGVLVIAIVLIVLGNRTSHKSVPIATSPDALSGIQTGNAPWIAETANLRDRLKQIGLPALSVEGSALHTHQHLDIFIHGKPIAVPAGIGVNQAAGFISPIHTHDDTSIIHVESPTIQTFTLGQFFDIWGVRFTQNSIGGYVADQTDQLHVYVNGQLYQDDPRNLALVAHQEIVIAFGTSVELPNPIQSSFAFPSGD
jgi:hypothetical protein